jgi:hypothetical protein
MERDGEVSRPVAFSRLKHLESVGAAYSDRTVPRRTEVELRLERLLDELNEERLKESPRKNAKGFLGYWPFLEETLQQSISQGFIEYDARGFTYKLSDSPMVKYLGYRKSLESEFPDQPWRVIHLGALARTLLNSGEALNLKQLITRLEAAWLVVSDVESWGDYLSATDTDTMVRLGILQRADTGQLDLSNAFKDRFEAARTWSPDKDRVFTALDALKGMVFARQDDSEQRTVFWSTAVRLMRGQELRERNGAPVWQSSTD